MYFAIIIIEFALELEIQSVCLPKSMKHTVDTTKVKWINKNKENRVNYNPLIQLYRFINQEKDNFQLSIILLFLNVFGKY